MAKEKHGKTSTLLNVIQRMKEIVTPIEEEEINGVDKYASFQVKGKRIVVCTIGDPVQTFFENMEKAVVENADVIVCASRLKGKTFKYVEALKMKGYEIILFSNFFATEKDTQYESDLHVISAELILKLIQSL